MKRLWTHRLEILTILFLSGCSQSPPLPSISLVEPAFESRSLAQESILSIPDPCKKLKIVGDLTLAQFQKLFSCLNKKGGLKPLEPVLFQNLENSHFFVKLYNDTFGKSETRTETLKLIETLESNGGLSDILSLISLFIAEFIDTPHFDQVLKELLESALNDDISLLPLFQNLISYPHSQELSTILNKALQNGTLKNYLNTLGNFLRLPQTPDHFTDFLNQLSTRWNWAPSSFNLEDVYQLHFFKLPRGLLEVLYKLQMTSKLPILIRLAQDLATHQTATILTQERREKLKVPHSLPDEQKQASLEIIQKHPASDLAAFVKLISSFNRRFSEDENSQNRNLLSSLDSFVQGVKTAFDAEHTLGPDSQATRIVTIYSLFLNLSYQEITDAHFHALSLEEKFQIYTSQIPRGEAALYSKLILDYQAQKTKQVLYVYKLQLESENRYLPSEIRRLLRIREKEFKDNELPSLLEKYKMFIHNEVTKALSLINTRPLFLNFTIYDFLIKLKENKEPIALFAQKALLNLDNELLEKFIQEVIHGLLKDFFIFNRPVDEFMSSQDIEYSGSTWLSHTVDPLIHGFGNDLPMKDQITLIAVIESYQALERLLVTENKISEIKEVILPFLKVINSTGQDERILKLVSALHTGKFTDEQNEEKELITHLSRLLVQMIDSGFFQNSLDVLALFGKEAETLNQFLEFLTRSSAKSEFLKLLNHHFSNEDSILLKEQIIYDVHTITETSELPFLAQKLSLLRSPPEHSLLMNSDYPLTGLLKTFGNLAQKHPEAFKKFLSQWGHFLTPLHIQTLDSFLNKYMGLSSSSKENTLMVMIKTGEIERLFTIVDQMLKNNTFQNTYTFMKELIDTGELEKTLQLLVKLLRMQEK